MNATEKAGSAWPQLRETGEEGGGEGAGQRDATGNEREYHMT